MHGKLNRLIRIKVRNTLTSPSNAFNVIFGQARAFYQLKINSQTYTLVAYTPLEQLELVLNFPRGEWNTNVVKVANIVDITSIIAIWEAETSKKIYILRKHPGLAMLHTEECGIENNELAVEDGEGSDDDEADSMVHKSIWIVIKHWTLMIPLEVVQTVHKSV
ncbi:hypothetical protein BDZ97DRAFT_1752476 [Flammula alnicola]|nr:hypothetical protein BDZ97DRAFT_1752476 [Flammula alnicola]